MNEGTAGQVLCARLEALSAGDRRRGIYFRPWLSLLIVLALLLGACGGEDGSGDSRTDGTSVTSEKISMIDSLVQSHPEQALAQAQEALATLDLEPGADAQVQLELIVADCLIAMGRGEEAQAGLESTVEAALLLDDPVMGCRGRMALALIKRDRGELAEARQELAACLEITMKNEIDLNWAAVIANRLATVDAIMGQMPEALGGFQLALERYREIGRAEECIKIQGNIATVHGLMGNWEECLRVQEEILPAIEARGDRRAQAIVLLNIAATRIHLDDFDGALDALLKGQEFANEGGLESLRAEMLVVLTTIYSERRQVEDALRTAREAVELTRRLGLRPTEAAALIALSELEYDHGNSNAGKEAAQRALTIYEEIGETHSLIDILEVLGERQEKDGEFKAALATLKRRAKIREQVLGESAQARVQELDAEHQARERKRMIELLEQKNRVSELELEGQRQMRSAMIAGFGLLTLVGLLLFARFRFKARERLMLATVEREQQVNSQLQEIDRLKDEFLAITSHELKAPLFGITGLAEALVEDPSLELTPRARTDLEMIHSSGCRLGSLVEDILDYSKLQRGRSGIVIAPLELRALTDVVLTLAAPLIGDKEIELVNAVELDLPLVPADESRIQQVLLNLVGNSIKFSDRGTIEVKARVLDAEMIVSVKDSGRGIEPNRLERVFESYEQGEETVSRTYGGTGLGLAISKHLVELHGGRIWVESQPDHGSVFSFMLPLVHGDQVSGLPGPADETLDPRPAVEGVLADGLPGEGSTILVVDDEEVVRRILEGYLVNEGHRVLAASSGEEALPIIAQEEIDLVLLDVMMPRMSGFELCRRIREEKSLEELPILMLSGMARAEDHVAGFQEGANDYLDKPVSRDELVIRVQTHLALLRVHRSQVKEVKILRGLLPICSYCKKIRDEHKVWSSVEDYIDQHSEAEFSHGICPDCTKTHHPEVQQRGR